MSDGPHQQPSEHGATEEPAPEVTSEAEWRRRRRLAEIFGEVLPDTTSDERDPGRGDGGRDPDEWLRSQVPPHHG